MKKNRAITKGASPEKEETSIGTEPVPETAEKILSKDIPIVGLGASAGGLEAFEHFFKHMPPNSGAAFVLISHMDPNYASMMTELIQRLTQMPVKEATDQMPVKPDHVYVS